MTEKVEVITLGCRLNTYESEVIKKKASDAGVSKTLIINTCAVTAEAERQARQIIRREKRKKPDVDIIVTGCSAQINPQKWLKIPEVNRVLGNVEKLQSSSYLTSQDHPLADVNDIMSVREQAGHLISGFEGRARAFVQVQQGCDHRCTFCVIPFGRGNSRSVPLGDIVAEARTQVANGYREIVLTGVDLTSYGHDLPGNPSLGQAVRRLLAAVPELPRLRLSSLDPSEIDPDLMLLFASEPRLMPHLHLSVQSGDDLILKRMKRRHSRNDVISVTKKLKDLRPEIVFGADFIAGFPTETDDMFHNTLRLIDEATITWLHVFPYSSRPNTPAAKMPQIPVSTRKIRAAELRGKGKIAAQKHLKNLVGSKVSVLLEGKGKGRSEDFANVNVKGNFAGIQVVEALISHSDGMIAYGSPV